MRLIENKEDIKFDNITDRIYLKQKNTRKSINTIFLKQGMDIYELIESNFLMNNIYNEVKRE